MKVYETKAIRNFAVLGNGASGKTSFSEAVLFSTGAVGRIGKIEDGNTKSDYTEDEIARKTSITTSLLQSEWNGFKINMLDTPGYSDFIGETICALRAADFCVIIIDALSGIEIGTENAWELVEKSQKPTIFVVNRVGKEHAKAEAVLASIQQRFGIKAVPVQIPVNPGVGFNSLVDLISMKQYTYKDGKGTISELSEDIASKAAELHEKLVEGAAESDDTLMEKFFDTGLTHEEFSLGIKEGILNKSLIPILFADAYTNVGTDLFLKFITDSAPSPSDVKPPMAKKSGAEIEIKTSNDEHLVLQVFKTVVEHHIGEYSLFKVLSGSYKAGEELYNVNHSASEKPTLIHSMIGKDRADVPTINAGDIGAFVKMKATKVGDTLTNKQFQVELPSIQFPVPVMDVAVYPKTKGEEDKISQGLVKMNEEDPSFHVRTDSELKQIILEGQGGLHIDILLDKFRRKFGVEIEIKAPRIPYRETITGKSDEHYRYKKQTGGRGQYGDVYFRMEPTNRGDGFVFADEIKGGVIPARFIPAVEKGLQEAMERGPLSHSKVIDVRVALYYGSYHTVDSSEMAFKMASRICFRECFLKANPILLEPIYNIEIKVPEAYTGDVMGDMSSRRGKIMGMEPSGIFQIVKVKVPLSELYMYSTHLRSLTQGRGVYTKSFSHYEMVPPDVSQKIIEATKAEAIEEE